VNKRQRKRERKRARFAAFEAKQRKQLPSPELTIPALDGLQSEVVEDVPATRMTPNVPQRQIRQQAFQLAAEFHSGPLPHPDILAKYNDVIPNGAERMMQAFEKQQEHRQTLEKSVIGGNVKAETRGQWMGLAVTIGVLVLAGYIAHTGNQYAAGGVAVADIATLAGVFVYGKKTQRRELTQKREQIKGRSK
jgi:uncharacterized membrane protein